MSYPLLDSARTSSGKRYSFPALPKLTRISFRPRFSTALTKVPSRGKRLPVFCDRIGLMVFNGSPGLMVPPSYVTAVSLLFISHRLLKVYYRHSSLVPKRYTQLLDVGNRQNVLSHLSCRFSSKPRTTPKNRGFPFFHSPRVRNILTHRVPRVDKLPKR